MGKYKVIFKETSLTDDPVYQDETIISDNNTTDMIDSDEDMYTYTFSFNGKFLKKLALASINKHMSISDLVNNSLIEGVGDKILDDEEKAERKNLS